MRIRYNLNSKTLHLQILKKFIKIPLSIKSAQSIKQEIKNYSILTYDLCFKNYILPYKSLLFILITEKKVELNILDSNKFLKEYYKNLIKYSSTKIDTIENLINLNQVEKFLKENLDQVSDIFFKFKKGNKVKTSPGHGDLYYKNILTQNNIYYIIDWPLYDKYYTFNFDLINYKIFSSKYYKNNWYQFLKKNKKFFLKFIEDKYLKVFVLIKVNNELRFTKLNKVKIEKYKFILRDLFSNF